MTIRPCPNCGYTHNPGKLKLGEEILLKLSQLKEVTTAQRVIFIRLMEANGAMVTKEQLMTALYHDDHNGGPESGERCLFTFIAKLRKPLKQFKYTIIGQRTLGYWLVKVTNR